MITASVEQSSCAMGATQVQQSELSSYDDRVNMSQDDSFCPRYMCKDGLYNLSLATPVHSVQQL